MDRGHLYHFWEAFLGVPRDLPCEQLSKLKERKLKTLLGTLLEILPQSSDQLHELIDLHSVSNVLIQEFLSDVKTIAGEDVSTNFPELLDYLSRGRGAVMIIIMVVIGIRDLIRGSSFGKCLISLLRRLIVSKSSSSWSAISKEIHLSDLELFIVQEPRLRKPQTKELEDTLRPGNNKADDSETSDPELSCLQADVKTQSHRTLSARLRRQQNEPKDSSDSDSDASRKLLVVFREIRRTFRNVPHLVEDFFVEMKFHSLGPGLVGDDRSQIELSVNELCLLLVSLLKDVCFDDDQYREERSTCMHLLPIFEDLLCDLIDRLYEINDDAYGSGAENCLGIIGRCLLRIFVVLTSKISSQIDGLLVLHGGKTPNAWLARLLKHLNGEVVNSKEKFLFSYDSVRTCLLYAEIVLSSVRLTPLRLASALDATEFVLHDSGLELLDSILLQLNEESSDEQSIVDVDKLVDDLLASVGQVIGLLKLLRARYIHLLTCPKRVHLQCSSFMSYAHHHDVLGLASHLSLENDLRQNVDGRTNSHVCVIAVISLVLVSVFKKSHESTKLRILSALETCGLCCCVPLEMFTKSLLSALDAHETVLKTKIMTPSLFLSRKILSVLTDFFITEFGGALSKTGSLLTTVKCQICTEEMTNSTSIQALPCPGGKMETSDSALSDCDSHCGMESLLYSRWSCLKLLLPLFSCANDVIALHIKLRVFDLVQKANSVLKYELLYFVFLPILQESERFLLREPEEKDPTDGKDDRALRDKSLESVCYCLSVLPRLLTASSACELFVASNGIRILENLALEKTVQFCVVRVIRELLFVQDFQLKKDESSLSRKSFQDQITLSSKESTSLPEDRKAFSIAVSSCTVLVKLLFQDLHDSRLSFNDIASDRLRYNSHVWKTANSAIQESELLRNKFVEDDGPDVARALLFEGVKFFLRLRAPHMTTRLRLDMMNDRNYVHESLQPLRNWFLLVRAALGVVLFCARRRIKFGLKELTVDDVVNELSEVVARESEVSFAYDDTLMLLCELLLVSVDDRSRQRRKARSPSFKHLCFMRGNASSSDEKAVHFDRDQSYFRSFDSTVDFDYDADHELTTFPPSDGNDVSRVNLMSISNADTYPELCRLLLRVAKNRLTSASSHDVVKDSSNAQTVLLNQDDGSRTFPVGGDSENHSKNQTMEKSSLQISSNTEELKDNNLDSDPGTLLSSEESSSRASELIGEAGCQDTVKRERSVASNILKRIALYAKSSPSLTAFIYQQNLVEDLILLYKESHSSDVEVSRDVLCVLLDLLSRVSKFGLSSNSMSAFLSLFRDGENLDLLLSALKTMTFDLPQEPRYSLRMPANISSFLSDDFVVLFHENTLPGSETIVDPIASISSQSSDHVSEGNLIRPVVKAGLRNTVMPFGAKDGKLSVAFWMMLESGRESERTSNGGGRLQTDVLEPPSKRSQVRSRLRDSAFSETPVASHVLSISDSDLMIEVWIKEKRAGIAVRIVSVVGGFESILNEVFIPLKIVRGRWHHVVLTYDQLSSNEKDGRTSANITVYLDGLSENSVSMKWPSRESISGKVVSSAECCLYLGHCNSNGRLPEDRKIHYRLGSVFLFQDLLLTKVMSFYLFCLGPDCLTLNQCDSSELNPTFLQQLHALALNSRLPAQDVELASLLALMQNSLLLIYSPCHPDVAGFSKDVSVDPKAKKTVHSSSPSSANSFTLQPTWIRVRTLSDLKPVVGRETMSGVQQLGGIGVFLYLFAKVVEFGTCESDQVKALSVVFNLMESDRNLMEEFTKLNGYAMLVKVLLTPQSLIGFEILKVLLDASVTSSMLSCDRVSKSYSINTDVNTTLLIRDVRVIVDILLAWTVWNRTSDDVWLLGLKAVNSLIEPKHRQREYNIKALLAGGAVEKLFNICLERLQMSYPSLSLPLCQVFLDIVRNLVAFRPDIHHVLQISDFLLLTHPAANTFIFHNPTTFCFRNKWISGERPTTFAVEGGKVVIPGATEDSKPSVYLSRKSPVLGFFVREAMRCGDSIPESGKTDFSVSTTSEAALPLPFGDAAEGKAVEKSSVVCGNGLDASNSEVAAKVVGTRGGAELIVDRAKDFDTVYHNSVLAIETNQAEVSRNDSATSSESVLKNDSAPTVITGTATTGTDFEAVGIVVPDLDHRDECTEIYQHEVIGSSVTPDAPTVFAEEDLTSPSEDRALGLNVTTNSSGSEGVRSNPSNQETISVDRLTLSEKFEDDDEDRDACDAALMDVIDKDDKGLVRIIIGLLELVVDLLPSLKTIDRDKIFNTVLQPQVLVVMAHHAAADIRIAILRMLKCYLKLCNLEQKELFLKSQVYHLVANQLHQHSSNATIIEECLSILIGQSVQINEILDLPLPLGLPLWQQMSVSLLLSVAEGTVADPALCRGLLSSLQKIFVSLLDVSQVMLENGLAEVLCNMIHHLGFSWNSDRSDLPESSGRQILLDGIQTMFCLIAQKTFCTTGSSFFQQFEETFVLLKCLETRLKGLHGKESPIVLFVSVVQCTYLRTILEDILQNFSSTNETSFSLSAIQTTASRENLEVPPRSSLANDSSSDTSGQSTPRRSVVMGNFEMSLTPSELSERFKRLIGTAVDFVLFRGNDVIFPRSRESSPEIDAKVGDGAVDPSGLVSAGGELRRFLLVFLMQALELAVKKGRKYVIGSLMSQTKDVIRKELSRLLLYFVSPSTGLEQNLFAIETFNHKPSNMELLKLLITVSDLEQKLSYYVYALVTSHATTLTRSQRSELGEFIERLVQCNFEVIRPGASLSPDARDRMKKNMEEWGKKFQLDRREWLKKEGRAFQRVLHRLDGLSRKLSSLAMEFTQSVNNDQNKLRKRFIRHMRNQMADRLHVKKSWQQLIAQLSHERAVWHCANLYPDSWQLDPNEGPSRQRCRLSRCQLNLDDRFFLPEQRLKHNAVKRELPLSFLFHDDRLGLDSAAVIYKLHTSENIEHTFQCRNVTPQVTTSGFLLMGQTVLYYVADDAVSEDNYTQALLGNCDNLFMTLSHDDIIDFRRQWYLLRDEAVEIFLSNGKTCLLALSSTRDRDELCQKLTSLDLPNVQPADNLLHAQTLWIEGSMTNFEYLMHLNKMAGRSFNDLMQYPVFPFILSQYTEPALDLENPASYRVLSKTISTQFKEQEEKYIQLYQLLTEQKLMSDGTPDILLEPYHYTNHYSNVATVLQFLVRLPPFTQMFIDFQDKNFDCADRMFHSIQISYNLVTKMSMTDSKELIPEFFYLPEILENSEGFNFGVRQNGQVVCDVDLPPWCRKNPRLFTLVHRQALESDHVTRTLASWIDLVFGCKQQGKAAIDAVNVFRPSMYFGINVDAIEDELTRKAVKTMIRTHGQTPKQLFKNPHPSPQIRPTPTPTRNKPSPLPQILGLRWGDYVGSPDCPNPAIVSCESFPVDASNLVVLPTGDVYGLGSNCCFLVKQKGLKLTQPIGLNWSAVLSWGYRDGIIRLKNNQKRPPVNFLHWDPTNQVTCAASLTNCSQIFFGTELGSIVVLNTKLNASKPSHLQVFDHRVRLFGHRGRVSCLCVCQAFSVLVSAGLDSSCIIWDLNRLCYVRSISDHNGNIRALCVSSCSGDIASTSDTDDNGSCLMIHTINARFIAKFQCPDRILCVAFSPRPEGQSVNVVVGGLSNGRIRLWSSWDLTPVRELIPSKSPSPVLSLTYSQDGQNIFSLMRGLLTVWGNKPSTQRTKKFNFIPLL